MAMAYAGARGDTASQISDVLHFSMPDENVHSAFDAIDEEIASHAKGEEDFKLNMANSIWGQKDRPFLPEYLDTLSQYYGAGLHLVDFIQQTEDARQKINQWVSEKTQQKITDLIPPGAVSSLTRLVIVNAIYFKAGWRLPFDQELTKPGNFFFIHGGQTTVQMMHQTGTYGYSNMTQYQALELPYKGDGMSMLIIMPADKEFENIENSLNAEKINEIVKTLEIKKIDLTFPKFSVETGYSITDPLIEMGILNAFAPLAANFSGIDGTRDLYIDKIAHKAYVNVDENGTEAAAATAAMMAATSLEPEEPTQVVIDHPFIFAIRDQQTKVILFLGRIYNPKLK